MKMNIRALVELIRPQQWTKNLVVFAGVVFSGRLFDPHALARSVAAFIAFCLVSAALYAVNDVRDAEQDALHPTKSMRPVASGRVSRGTALLLATFLTVSGVGIAALISVNFLLVVLAYIGLQVLYMAGLKNQIILDMLVIAGGFVIRAVAGAVVIDVVVSPWLLVCTGTLALFLSAAKRRHELVLLGDDAAEHRPVLAEYSAELLDSIMVTLSAATITCYTLYTFFAPTNGVGTMMLTIPFVLYGVLRYQYLVLNKSGGGRPEDVLLGDAPIGIDIVLWMISVVIIGYVY